MRIRDGSVLHDALSTNELADTPFFVSITIPLLRKFLVAEVTGERLSSEMSPDMVLHVRELCENLWTL